MSTYISNAFVQQYSDTFHILAQQKVSRLERFVTRQSGLIVGASFVIDRLAKGGSVRNKPRHADLNYQNLENDRRYGDMVDVYSADLIDKFDKLKLLIEPTNSYTQNLISAVNRDKDSLIVQALGASVRTDSGTSALGAGQKIAVGGTGLTLAKLRQAKLLLDDAQMDDTDFFSMMGTNMAGMDINPPAYILVCRAKDIDNLLGDTTVTSSDYNAIKALVNGTINTYMGFKFVILPTTNFETGSSSDTFVYAYAPKSVKWGVGQDVSSAIDWLPTKQSWQVCATASYGCARAEDEGVVQIAVST